MATSVMKMETLLMNPPHLEGKERMAKTTLKKRRSEKQPTNTFLNFVMEISSEYIKVLRESYLGMRREKHRMYIQKRKNKEINIEEYHKLKCIMAEMRAIINQGGKTIFI